MDVLLGVRVPNEGDPSRIEQASVLLPAGLARTMGYWFGARQSLSQTLCLILIDALLLTLIALDRRHHSSARLYISVLLAYAAIEAFWFSLGRPI